MNLIDLISKHPVPVTRFQRPYVIAEAGVNHEGSMDIARRSLVANRNIPAGKIIDKDDLTWKRPAGGISPRHYYEVLGMTARADIEEDTVLQWAHLE